MICTRHRLFASGLVAALLLAPPALAGDGAEVLTLLEKTRMQEAAALLAQLPESDPWRPWAQASMGFHRGDYAAARKVLPAPGADPEREARVPWLRRRLEQSYQATLGMLSRPEGNFVYRFLPGVDAILPEYAGLALEAQRTAIGELLGVVPAEPTLVEFFPTVEEFVMASGLPREWVETTHTVAIAKWDRILVLSPMNMPQGYPWQDTLAHEYVHLALSRASGNTAPVWFQEGSAKLLEGRWRGAGRGDDFLGPWAQSLLVTALREDALVPFAKMHPSMAALPSSEVAALAFAQVACAVDFIFESVGDAGYRSLVENSAALGDVMLAISAVLGLTESAFVAGYQKHIRGKGLTVRAQVSGLVAKLRAGAAGAPDPASQGLDPVLVEHQRMQQHARLGDLLRLRGHREAALVEYARATRAEPYHSPALANKQAIVLRALGRTHEARALLKESVELYPEYTPTTTLLAELAAQAGDVERARILFVRSNSLNPFNPLVHRQLAAILEQQDDAAGSARERRVLRVLGDYLGR
jgi:tetratricopeptide (TPR) repeat protein